VINQILHEHDAISRKMRQELAVIVGRDKEGLAEVFYREMTADPDASKFLSAKSVESHLKPGLGLWLSRLFCHETEDELKAVLALQRHVGQVHSRAEIPVQMVVRGMRLLKREINARLIETELDRETLIGAILYADRLIDIAFEEMSSAFVHNHDSDVRVDEGFRLFVAGQNLSLEKEKQSGALLEWENRLFRAVATDVVLDESLSIKNSSFGLWFHHKASLIFEESSDLTMLEGMIQRLDDALTTQIFHVDVKSLQSNEIRTLIRAVMAEVGQIRYLLNEMFERVNDLEVGRDVLTQLYNRRFLPTILKREIAVNRKRGERFFVLMLDIDWFKRVNDEYGHDSGDQVLQAVAGLIVSQVRASDFVFRYGGEEFLIVLAEVDMARSQTIAEKIRRCIQDTQILLSNDRKISVTLSIGLSGFDGNPDYQRTLDRADKALYAAKNAGRNRCVLAPD
jgi:diguanylate cyclase